MVSAGVFIQDLHKPSIKILEEVGCSTPVAEAPNPQNAVLVIEGDWRAPMIDFIVETRS